MVKTKDGIRFKQEGSRLSLLGHSLALADGRPGAPSNMIESQTAPSTIMSFPLSHRPRLWFPPTSRIFRVDCFLHEISERLSRLCVSFSIIVGTGNISRMDLNDGDFTKLLFMKACCSLKCCKQQWPPYQI